MTPTVLLAALSATPGQLPPLSPPFDRRQTDPNVRQLYNEDVRKDPKRLAAVLDKLWAAMPDPFQDQKRTDLARQLVPFIALESPTGDARESAVGGGTGRPVYSMLLNIGLPAVPPLLEQLTLPDDKEYRVHKELVARCLVYIYDRGGEGRKMAAARVRLFAEDWPAETKQRILRILDETIFQPPPPPVEPAPKK